MIPVSGEGKFHEGDEVYQGPDCVRAEAGGERHAGR